MTCAGYIGCRNTEQIIILNIGNMLRGHHNTITKLYTDKRTEAHID